MSTSWRPVLESGHRRAALYTVGWESPSPPAPEVKIGPLGTNALGLMRQGDHLIGE